MDVRITFDERDMTTTFTDTIETGEVRVVVTYPDEIPRDLGKSIKLSTDWVLSIPARTDLFGKIMQGTYTVLVERYDVGGATPTESETVSFELSYSDVPVAVGETWDVFTPMFRLTDTTIYERPGFFTTAPLNRLWTAGNGQQEWSQTSLAALTLYDGGYFTGDYEWSLDVDVTSTMDNDYVTVITKEVVSGTKTIKSPPMLEEIYALMGCLFGKMKAKECCKDASYDRMKADYIYASSLLFNFVLGGQAGNTTQLADMLNGTDCQDGILTILKRWGCYDETIANTAISAYDFCLCSDSGAGGGTATNRGWYSAGNDCLISSDATDDDDQWTFAVASGVGSFTQNLAGSRIFGGTVRGDSATAAHTSNGATNSFKLVLPIPGTESTANAGYATALLAGVQVWSAPDSNPSASSPWVLDEGSVQKRIVDISSGTISIVFAGIGATYPDGWAVTFEMP
jgi:hypothetical protein